MCVTEAREHSDYTLADNALLTVVIWCAATLQNADQMMLATCDGPLIKVPDHSDTMFHTPTKPRATPTAPTPEPTAARLHVTPSTPAPVPRRLHGHDLTRRATAG